MSNEWQVFNLTPFTHTIKLEADMLLDCNIDHWWYHLHQHNIAIDDGRQVWYTLSQPLPGGIAKPTQQLLQQRTKELA